MRALCTLLALALLGGCAPTLPAPARVAPRPYTASDAPPPGRSALLVDVTNADAVVHAAGDHCIAPCVLWLRPGKAELSFGYTLRGIAQSDEVTVTVTEEPQVYRRAVTVMRPRYRGMVVAWRALFAVGMLSMAGSLVVLAEGDTHDLKAARRGLGYGGLAVFGVELSLVFVGLDAAHGRGVGFPWVAADAAR